MSYFEQSLSINAQAYQSYGSFSVFLVVCYNDPFFIFEDCICLRKGALGLAGKGEDTFEINIFSLAVFSQIRLHFFRATSLQLLHSNDQHLGPHAPLYFNPTFPFLKLTIYTKVFFLKKSPGYDYTDKKK